MFCVVLAENSLEKLYAKLKGENKHTDLFELRLDFLDTIEESLLEEILAKPYRFICTVRAKAEGGKKEVANSKRWKILEYCGKKGAYLVDVEWKNLFYGRYKSLIKKSSLFPEKVLFSYHDFEKTPSLKTLKGLLKRASSEGVKWFKITTFVKTFSEAIDLLSLIPYGKSLGIEVIAFGMGEIGKLSRILCLFAGAPFTYVFPKDGHPLAPGQLDILSAKKIYETLKNV